MRFLCWQKLYRNIVAFALQFVHADEICACIDSRRIIQIMKNFSKKILALILCAASLLTFVSCSTLVGDDKGAVIDVYLTNEIYNFDPAYGFTDASTAKILSLIFEGLTRLDEDGNWEKALMKSYEVSQDDDEGFKIQITLRDTKWSDARAVQANDIVYAWKRILEPEFKCEASSMLYDIKNARDVKMGDASVDDLGVFAIETYVLEIEFERKIDLDDFFRTVASPALVPLREDIVDVNANWAKKASTMITNGPFDVKELNFGETMRLERSAYYYRDSDSNQPLDKYVIPYRIITHYDAGILEEQLDAFLSGDIFYIGELPLAAAGENAREKYSEYANAADIPVTHTYFFNTNNEILSNANVRKALSMAIDRQAIADMVVYAKPATGFIPYKVYDADNKTYFRDVADADGAKISVAGDVAGARSLLSSAGVSGGTLSIAVRDDEVDYAVAEAVKSVWEELGFTVKIRVLTYTYDAEDSTVIVDEFQRAYTNGDFDVIAVDVQMLSSDAYSALAPFAVAFSGNGVDMNSENYNMRGHVTGYNSDAYNALFEDIYESADRAEDTALLHRAEDMLLDDAVIMPIYFEQDAFMYSDVLSGLGATYFGRSFNSVKMKDYMSYKEAAEAVGDEYLNNEE